MIKHIVRMFVILFVLLELALALYSYHTGNLAGANFALNMAILLYLTWIVDDRV